MTIIQDIITFQSGHLIIMRRAYRFKSLHVFFRHQTCNDYNYGHRNIAQLSDALIKMHKYLYICMYILIRRLHIFHKLDLFLISWLLYVSIFLTTTRTYILNSKFQIIKIPQKWLDIIIFCPNESGVRASKNCKLQTLKSYHQNVIFSKDMKKQPKYFSLEYRKNQYLPNIVRLPKILSFFFENQSQFGIKCLTISLLNY